MYTYTVYTYTHTYIYTQIYIYIQICIYMYTYTEKAANYFCRCFIEVISFSIMRCIVGIEKLSVKQNRVRPVHFRKTLPNCIELLWFV